MLGQLGKESWISWISGRRRVAETADGRGEEIASDTTWWCTSSDRQRMLRGLLDKFSTRGPRVENGRVACPDAELCRSSRRRRRTVTGKMLTHCPLRRCALACFTTSTRDDKHLC